MEEVIKEVVYSSAFFEDLKTNYLYGKETFGRRMADFFQEEVLHSTYGLSYSYNIHPECRYLETKSQIYRNFILGKYLIIYRIRSERIEVLRMIHGSQSTNKIQSIKKIKIN